MVHKNDFYERLYIYIYIYIYMCVCVTDIVRPHHHRTTHCRKNGNGTIIVYPAQLGNKEYQSCWPVEDDNRKQL